MEGLTAVSSCSLSDSKGRDNPVTFRCESRTLFLAAAFTYIFSSGVGCTESDSPTAPEVPRTDDRGGIGLSCATPSRFTQVAHNSTCDSRPDRVFLCDLEILLENNCERAYQHVSVKWSLSEEGSETRLFRTEGICWAGDSPGVGHVEYTTRSVPPGGERRVDGCLAFRDLAPGRYSLHWQYVGCTDLTSRSSCFGVSSAPREVTLEVPVEIGGLGRW